jgi:hypothetical protein
VDEDETKVRNDLAANAAEIGRTKILSPKAQSRGGRKEN